MSESETKDDPEGTPAPAEEPAEAPAEPEQTPEQKQEESKADKRFSRLTARMASLARERDELAQRLSQVEAAQRGVAPEQLSPDVRAMVEQEVQRRVEQRVTDAASARFHEAAFEAYDDWETRRHRLVALGADAGIASILVKMSDGVRVAGALHDNPDELERIAQIPTQEDRAIALGKFAAKLEARPTRAVSRAPRPPAPVDGRTSPKFNEYSTNLSAQDLVEVYRKQEMEKRRQG